MPAQCYFLLGGGYVPQFDSFVLASGGQHLAIGAESNGEYPMFMAFQGGLLFQLERTAVILEEEKYQDNRYNVTLHRAFPNRMVEVSRNCAKSS